MNQPQSKADTGSAKGFACAASAFLIWGLSPIYWKSLSGVPALEVLLHRVVWSFLFLAPLLVQRKHWYELVSVFKNPRVLLILSCTTLLVSTNWLVFIWAVNSGFVLQTSLGYYINPLLNVVLGMLFLKEHLRPAQATAVILAGIGVVYFTVSLGQFPWIAFSLAVSFGLYGLIRKIAPVSALVGLAIETMLLFVPSAGRLAYLYATERGAFQHLGWSTDWLLMASALATALPLLLFTLGARRLTLATVGFMQYIVPSCFFLFAVFVFKEPVSRAQIATFAFIWAALALYSADSVLFHRKLLHASPRAIPKGQRC